MNLAVTKNNRRVGGRGGEGIMLHKLRDQLWSCDKPGRMSCWGQEGGGGPYVPCGGRGKFVLASGGRVRMTK